MDNIRSISPTYSHQLSDSALCVAWNSHETSRKLGQVLAVGSADGELVLFWYKEDQTTSQSVENAHNFGIQCLSWKPSDECLLATGGQDGRVRFWKVTSKDFQKVEFEIKCGSSSWVQRILWHGDHVFIAIGRSIEIWNVSTEQKVDTYQDISSTITRLEYHPLLKKLVVASYGMIQLIDPFPVDGKRADPIQLSQKGSFISVSSDSIAGGKRHLIAGGMQDAMLTVWSLNANGSIESQMEYGGFGEKVNQVEFSPDGVYLAASGAEAVVMWRVMKNSTGAQVLRPSPKLCLGFDSPVQNFLMHPKLPMMAAIAKEGLVYGWNFNTITMTNPDGSGICLPQVEFSASAVIEEGASGITMSWDSAGTVLANSFTDGTVLFFNTRSILA